VRAVVLVGGFGTRLRPLTLSTPKQMLPLVDRPMIEWVVGHLGRHGVTEAVLSLGYRPDAFTEAYVDGTCAGVSLHYAVEPEPLDTAGAIRFAARDAGIDERFLVVNGDVLTDFDLDELCRFHDERGAEATIHLTPVDDPSRYGVVPIDDKGRVEAFVEKPPADQAPSNWINAGAYVLEPSVVDRIAGDRKVSIERETFPALVDDGSLFAVQADDYWIDAGTPETYLQAQLDLIGGRRPEHPPAVAADVQIADATVRNSVLMRGAAVASGATVESSVVLPGARIGEAALVRDSIVGPGASVGAGAHVDHLSVLGDAVQVEPGARLDGQRVPDEAS
jgi:mannose-1-phosphate guanylyltransferase